MSGTLSDLLDDIQEDPLEDKPFEDILPDTPVTQLDEDDSPVQLESFSENIVGKVLEHARLTTIRKVVGDLPLIDMKTAMEAIAGLPESTTLQAKLTTTPSSINKRILASVMDSINDDLTPEDRDTLNTYSANLSVVIPKLKDSVEYVSKTVDELKVTRNGIGRVPVVYRKNNYDVLTSSLVDLGSIDDKELYYKPFEGKLTSAITNLYYSEEFSQLVTRENSSAYSLYNLETISPTQVVDLLLNMSITYRDNYNRLVALHEQIKQTLSANKYTSTLCSSELIDTLSTINRLTENINYVNSLLESDKDLLGKVRELFNVIS